VFDRAGVVTLNDLSAADVVARAEASVWALIELPASYTQKTAAYHGKYARSFTRWLWRNKGLLAADPLAGMELPSQTTESPRRHLTPEELVKLVGAATASPKTVRHLPGPARALPYIVAAATGFRRKNCPACTPPTSSGRQTCPS
jgi:site-specific recombinase XerC